MRAKFLLITFCFMIMIFFSTGCDRSHSGAPLDYNSVNDPDPGTAILPHTPPTEPPPPGEGGGDEEGEEEGAGGLDPSMGGEGTGGDNQQPVPEPSTLILVGSGIALISMCRKKKKQQEKIAE